jgi:hypothetical protein
MSALIGGMLSEAKNNVSSSPELLVKLAPGDFYVKIVKDSFSAGTAILAHGAFNASSDYVALSVVASYSPRSGVTYLIAEDSNHKQYELEDIKKKALLYMDEQTLSHLKQNQSLWKRVKGTA